MPGIVIVARREGVESPCETIDRGLKIEIIVVGKYDIEAPVQLGGGNLTEALRDEGEADEVGLGTLEIKSAPIATTLQEQRAPTCETISFWVSTGKSRNVSFFLIPFPMATSSPAASAAMMEEVRGNLFATVRAKPMKLVEGTSRWRGG